MFSGLFAFWFRAILDRFVWRVGHLNGHRFPRDVGNFCVVTGHHLDSAGNCGFFEVGVWRLQIMLSSDFLRMPDPRDDNVRRINFHQLRFSCRSQILEWLLPWNKPSADDDLFERGSQVLCGVPVTCEMVEMELDTDCRGYLP